MMLRSIAIGKVKNYSLKKKKAPDMNTIAKNQVENNAITILLKILGAPDGLRPKALMLEKLYNANTAHGHRRQLQKISIIRTFRLMATKTRQDFSAIIVTLF